jgi:hypothetical protein
MKMANEQESSKLDQILSNQQEQQRCIDMQGVLFANGFRDMDARLIDKTTRGILEDDVKRGHMAAACRVTIKATFWWVFIVIGVPGWLIAALLYLNMLGVI